MIYRFQISILGITYGYLSVPVNIDHLLTWNAFILLTSAKNSVFNI